MPAESTHSLGRPPTSDLVLLAVAIAAVSTSAPLVRVAAAPSLAIACYRNLLAVPVVGAVAIARHRPEIAGLDRDERRGSLLAGALLAAHFATWIPSLSFTTVASSVALVATQPVWAAIIARLRGELVPRAAWFGIALAVSGAVVLSGIDLTISARALFGDMLAMIGGLLAAAYVTVGADVRRTVSTSVYTSICYAAAAGLLLVTCLVGHQSLTGYDRETWLAIIAMVIGPQLLGHTVINRVLRTTSATVVSVAILFEIVGSTILARIFFDESPPLGAIPAAALIGAGVVIVVRSVSQPAVSGAPALD